MAAIAIVGLLILAIGGARAAALILAGTPFALVGGVIAIALTGGVLSLGALVGFVTLFGIAARNDDHLHVIANLTNALDDPSLIEQLATTRDTNLVLEMLSGHRAA